MSVFQQLKEMWAIETFRTFCANWWRERELRDIDARIHALQNAKENLQSSKLHPFPYSKGKSVKALRKTFQECTDEELCELLTSFDAKYGKHKFFQQPARAQLFTFFKEIFEPM